MGATLSSALDDCHLRDVPAFFHSFGSPMSSTRHGGEETYMVYAPSGSTMSRNNNNNDEKNTRASYSGPSQGHVRSDLVAGYYKQSLKQQEVDPILSDLVDLCADGLEDEATRRQPAEGTDQPGGQVFKVPTTPPPRTPQLTSTSVPVTVSSSPTTSHSGSATTPNASGEWERAQAVALSGDSSEHDSGSDNEPSRTQRKKKKKKKSSRKERANERELLNISKQSGAASSIDSQNSSSYSHDGDLSSTKTGIISSDAGTNSTVDDLSTSNAKSIREHVRSERRASQDLSSPNNEDDTCRQEEARLKELLTISEGKEPAKEPLDSDDSDSGDGWNIVEAEWYREWTTFLKGGERPGQIQNKKLLDNTSEESEGEPRLGLEVGVHFVGFDDRAWGILSEVYGADVRIPRRRVDIYER